MLSRPPAHPRSPKPPPTPTHPSSRRKLCRPSRLAALAILLALTLTYLLTTATLPFSRLRPAPPPPPGTHPPSTDALLHLIAAECARRQSTYISVTPKGTIHTSPDPSGCRPLEIFLGPNERGFGMCTDVAFYVLHLGARLAPFSVEAFPQYNKTCQYPQTRARLHLETIYTEALTGAPRVKNVMLVNSEHLFTFDAHKHPSIDLFVCKTHFCVDPMKQYIQQRGLKAKVMFVGHSSLDPTAAIPELPWEKKAAGQAASSGGGGGDKAAGGLRAGVPGPGGVVKDYRKVLHVRGKSGLKHTQQILMCWQQQPDLPEITVVAYDYKLGWLVEFAGVPNIRFLPPIPSNDTLLRQVLDARQRLQQVQQEPWLLDRATFARRFRKHYARQHRRRRAADPFPAQAARDPPGDPAPGQQQQRPRQLAWQFRGQGAAEGGPTLEDLQRSEEGAYRAAAAKFRKQHDEAVTAAAKAVDRVIEEGPSVHGSISPQELQELQLEAGIHVCASVREGFGHYLNEARAAGALVVTTDHPPMNELVPADMGVLVPPVATNSIDLQSLGNIVDINAFLTPEAICEAMQRALGMTIAEKQERGQRARRAYERERCAFEGRLQELEAALVADG